MTEKLENHQVNFKAIEAFLEVMATERACASNSLRAYKQDLSDLGRFLIKSGKTLIEADVNLIEAYFIHLGQRSCKPATMARHRSAIRQFYRFAVGEEWCQIDPSRRVKMPKAQRHLPLVLDNQDFIALIEAARTRQGSDADRQRLICALEILYASGLRISELLQLSIKNLSSHSKNLTDSLIIKGRKTGPLKRVCENGD